METQGNRQWQQRCCLWEGFYLAGGCKARHAVTDFPFKISSFPTRQVLTCANTNFCIELLLLFFLYWYFLWCIFKFQFTYFTVGLNKWQKPQCYQWCKNKSTSSCFDTKHPMTSENLADVSQCITDTNSSSQTIMLLILAPAQPDSTFECYTSVMVNH